MYIKRVFIILFFLSFTNLVYTQNAPISVNDQDLYEDRIIDEFGNPMSGIRVSVRGKAVHTYTDFNGNFSIKARNGDLIILTKNGEQYASYRLDGSNEYRLDVSDKYEDSATLKSKNKKLRQSEQVSYLDSASYYLYKDSYKSIDFITQKLDSRTRNSKSDLAKSYTLLGDNYTQLKQYDLAVSNYKTALKSTSDIAIQLKYAKALSLDKQYKKSSKKYKNILENELSGWQIVLVYEGLGINTEKNKEYNKAIQHYSNALEMAKEHQIIPKIVTLNATIGKLLAQIGRNDDSEERLEETLKEAEVSHYNQRVQVQNTVADIYQSNKDYDNEIKVRKRTLESLEEAEVEAIVIDDESTEFPISKSSLNLDIGRAYIDKNEYDKAIPYLEKSAEEAVITMDFENQKNAIQKLSELYKKTGNSKKALSNYQEYAKIVDKLYQQKEEEIQDAVTLAKELQDKQNRINSLEKDRELTDSQSKLTKKDRELKASNNKRQQLLIYGLGLGLLLFAIALYYMYRSNKQRKLANNLLALKSLRSQMNPHFIFNALNSVNSFIAQSDERAANRYLTDFSQLMRSVLNNSEQDFISLEKEIELLQLYLKLEHSRFEDKFDYNINVDSSIEINEFQIPPMLLQPYVENAVWHGLRYRKTKGSLSIDFKQINTETISITISDDGIGRKMSKALKTQNQIKQKSKGMGNIKKRVQILNEMYADKVDVAVSDLLEDKTGTRVILTLKKD